MDHGQCPRDPDPVETRSTSLSPRGSFAALRVLLSQKTHAKNGNTFIEALEAFTVYPHPHPHDHSRSSSSSRYHPSFRLLPHREWKTRWHPNSTPMNQNGAHGQQRMLRYSGPNSRRRKTRNTTGSCGTAAPQLRTHRPASFSCWLCVGCAPVQRPPAATDAHI